MIDEVKEADLKDGVNRFIWSHNYARLQRALAPAGEAIQRVEVYSEHFQTIKVQLRAVGLMGKSPRLRSVKDTGTYWSLTPYGDAVMTRLRAVPHEEDVKF